MCVKKINETVNMTSGCVILLDGRFVVFHRRVVGTVTRLINAVNASKEN